MRFSMLVLVVVLGGCSERTFIPVEDAGLPWEGDSSSPDAGPDVPDALVVDAGADAALADAGDDAALAECICSPVPRFCPPRCQDAGPVDAGSPDAGPVDVDSGPVDAGIDAGPAPDPVIQFALNARNSCALRASGSVTCWPGNGVPVLLDAVAIVGDTRGVVNSDTRTYALRMDDSVVSWVGSGTAPGDVLVPETVMPPAPVPPVAATGDVLSDPPPRSPYVDVAGTQLGTPSTGFSAGDACGVREDGSVSCWGSNRFGEIGRDTGAFVSRLPWGEVFMDGVRMDAVVIGRSPVNVEVGHACAALRDGRVVCWGSNRQGQLGHWVDDLHMVGGLTQTSYEPVEPDAYYLD